MQSSSTRSTCVRFSLVCFFFILSLTRPVAADPSGDYQGWLWETGIFTGGAFNEEMCFSQVDLSFLPDSNWTSGLVDEVCWGRFTINTGRFYSNAPPFSVFNEEADQSTQPLISAGGNLYEIYGEEFENMVGQGEERFGTVLSAPSNDNLLIAGGVDSENDQFGDEYFRFIDLFVKSTPATQAARTAGDLAGSNWHLGSFVHSISDTNINAEFAFGSVHTLNLGAAGACSYSVSSILAPDFADNGDEFFALQFDNGVDFDDRFVRGGVASKNFSSCTYAIDADDYLAITRTVTLASDPLNPFVNTVRFVVSDDNRHFVPAPALVADDSDRGLTIGYRAASGMAGNAIDGTYLVYLPLSEFGADGAGAAAAGFGPRDWQELDLMARGKLVFDSTTTNPTPAGESGIWKACEFEIVLSEAEYEFTGSTTTFSVALGELSAETGGFPFDECDFQLGADGAISVHLFLEDGEEDFEPTFRGYVNDNAELISMTYSEVGPGIGINRDLANVFFVLGMEYTGDPDADADGDGITNLQEFQIPLPLPPFEGIVAMADISGNGMPEIGVAVPDSSRVQIRDASTDALVTDIDFGEDRALQMDLLPDLNANGNPEIAVLNEQDTGQVRVQIRDSLTGAVTKNMYYGLAYEPVAMDVVNDYSGNGLPEIAVLGSEAGTDAVRVQVQDTSTGFLDNVFLGTQSIASDLVSVADTSGNGIPEIGILGVLKSSNQVRSQFWDADTATFQANVWFGNVYQPKSIVTMPDSNANGSDEIVAMGVDPATQNIRVQVRDSDTTATLFNIWLGSVNAAVDIVVVNDINSDGIADLAVLLERPDGTARVRVQSGSNGAFIRNLFFNVVESPVGLAVVPDYNGSGFDELAVLGESAGTRHVLVLDTMSGGQLNRIDYP